MGNAQDRMRVAAINIAVTFVAFAGALQAALAQNAPNPTIKVVVPVAGTGIETGTVTRMGTVLLQETATANTQIHLVSSSATVTFPAQPVTIRAGKASATFEVEYAPGSEGVIPEVTASGFQVVRLSVNQNAAAVLSQMNINGVDGDIVPDAAPDSDGDGLPDNWEEGGYRSWGAPGESTEDLLVKFPAPTAIGPGTPPTFILARQAVTTSANSYDTDGDGLSDFVEVFGLKYIDDNGNGVLDSDEWYDANGDGLPSIGEYPLPNVDSSRHQDYDFDGFVFTDPSSADTDGDGILDGSDLEPLINPKTFGVAQGNFTRVGTNPADRDLDNDGLGNGADFGNDTTGIVDFPQDIANLMRIFRQDLYNQPQRLIPESLIEDLIGTDWDGNGLYRITDVRDFAPSGNLPDQISDTPIEDYLTSTQPYADRFEDLFLVGTHKLFAEPADPSATAATLDSRDSGATLSVTQYGSRGLGLGIQDILLPSEASRPFFPDVRVWTILYAWRVPGFDIDGNGYVGSPENDFRYDDRHEIVEGSRFDGRVEPLRCGDIGIFGLVSLILGFTAAKVTIPRARRRRGS